MHKLITQSRFYATAVIVLLHSWIGATAESIRYNPVSREVVEARLGKYTGSNEQREESLKQMLCPKVMESSTTGAVRRCWRLCTKRQN